MRVVLSGYYGFHNVGDEAILQAIIHALRQAKKDIQITVLSNDPDYTSKTYNVDAVNRWKLGQVMSAIRAADGVISGGGSLLQDKTGMKSVPYYTGIMMIARMLGKPFFIYAQGIGPLNNSVSQKLVSYALSKASFLTVRDVDSLQLLRRIGIKKEVELVPDPVMGMAFRKDLNDSWLRSQGVTTPFVTVAIRDWPSQVDFKKKIVKALDQCAAEGIDVVYVPMHGVHDDATSREMVEMMEEKAVVFPYKASIEEKISVIGDSDLLFGMRLHALIFAAVAHTPMIGLSYDPKIDSFINQVGQPLIGHVDEKWSADDLYKLIQQQLHDANQVSILKSKAAPLQQQANETAAKVVEYLS
ncbi:polysaccharide pyruvyl transferase CsaB [Bacillus sp. Marseille-P3661]|uniref:polysaccharide pyruvyl transferase CsaB n=1 Tax=Bacillus sp. Marseille-P3661 TaxID=1936234 RepID=UPI000C83EF6C|nr:polysaccharide pyruvyl transferase CsaB [Bacillus sp. Marseille-P3661]